MITPALLNYGSIGTTDGDIIKLFTLKSITLKQKSNSSNCITLIKNKSIMEKKMYYQIDNDDTTVTCDLDGCMEIVKAEADDYDETKNTEDNPQWIITLVWMTEEEYANLPEAY